MNDIREWAKEYCIKNNIKYKDLLYKSLKNYKNYIENDWKLEDYINSKNFKQAVKKLNSLLNENSDNWILRVINNFNDKVNYCDEYKEYLRENIINGQCELLQIKKGDIIKAYCIISYEDDNYGKYAFLHKINFIEKANMADYKLIEEKIIKYIKSKSIMYMDRILINADEEDIKKAGYFLLADNVSVKLNAFSNNIEIDYKYEQCDNIPENYYCISNTMPLRLEKKLNQSYRLCFKKGEFYISFKILKDNSLVNIYINNDSRNNDYLVELYNTIRSFMFNKGVKTIYTSIPKKHIILINKDFEIIGNILWIRKSI